MRQLFYLKYYPNYLFFSLVIILGSCDYRNNSSTSTNINTIIKNEIKNNLILKDSCDLEKYFASKHLVNIHALDTSVQVSLLYATNSNFLHKIIYNNLHDCYLPCDVAIKLANAQFYLKKKYPYYNLIVFDATRPLSIQQQMWDELDLPYSTKINYLAHPNDISLHNYGAAVDVGIIGENNLLLDMGSNFDSFELLSNPSKEMECLKNNTLSKEAYYNRLLLREVMLRAGFTSISSEWWHFNATTKNNAASKYELIH